MVEPQLKHTAFMWLFAGLSPVIYNTNNAQEFSFIVLVLQKNYKLI